MIFGEEGKIGMWWKSRCVWKNHRVVVSNIFSFHPYLAKWSNLTYIFQMGWNCQLDLIEAFILRLHMDRRGPILRKHHMCLGKAWQRLRKIMTWLRGVLGIWWTFIFWWTTGRVSNSRNQGDIFVEMHACFFFISFELHMPNTGSKKVRVRYRPCSDLCGSTFLSFLSSECFETILERFNSLLKPVICFFSFYHPLRSLPVLKRFQPVWDFLEPLEVRFLGDAFT